MKKILIICCLAVLGVGCGEGNNRADCMHTVLKKYPDCEVYKTGHSFKYLVVRKDGLKIIAECMNVSDNDISSETILTKVSN